MIKKNIKTRINLSKLGIIVICRSTIYMQSLTGGNNQMLEKPHDHGVQESLSMDAGKIFERWSMPIGILGFLVICLLQRISF